MRDCLKERLEEKEECRRIHILLVLLQDDEEEEEVEKEFEQLFF